MNIKSMKKSIKLWTCDKPTLQNSLWQIGIEYPKRDSNTFPIF